MRNLFCLAKSNGGIIMKVFQINGGSQGSTGKIMFGIANIAEENGMEYRCAYPIVKGNRGKLLEKNGVQIGTYFSRLVSVFFARLTGLNGCFARSATRKLLREIDRFEPNILHLHNLHDSYINLPLLFAYIKRKNIRVVWTLHDCWAFTGHCPHFDYEGCQKWKTGCFSCPLYKSYPKTYVDRSKTMYKRKKEWFTGVQDMTIVTPSHWLAGLVKQSFLKDYPVKVIHNGIDLSVFSPKESDFREKYGIGDKYIVLGVAFGWGQRKGLDVFIELAKRLDERFQIVLVGTDKKVDKQLPDNIISIHRTQNQKELAEIYTTVDVFANPTREEVLGLVNLESLACGTPVITFRTGGSPECIDETCGVVVEKDDINAMEREIIRVCEEKPFEKEACFEKAKAFDSNNRFYDYIKVYQGV